MVTAGFGLRILIRETRRKDRKTADDEVTELGDSLADCRQAQVVARRYVHDLRTVMADEGIEAPPRPW